MSTQVNNDASNIPPTIAGIVDGNGQFISRETNTTDFSIKVTLVGTATTNGQVKILRVKDENSINLGTAVVDAYGGWHWEQALERYSEWRFQVQDVVGEGVLSKEYKVYVSGPPQ